MSSTEKNSDVAVEKVAAEENSTPADAKEPVKGTKRPAEVSIRELVRISLFSAKCPKRASMQRLPFVVEAIDRDE